MGPKTKGRVRVLGVDWATEAKSRAAVELVLEGTTLSLERVKEPFSDTDAGTEFNDTGLDVIAVDTPFGWPAAFTTFVSQWSAMSGGVQPPSSDSFRFRNTDLVVKAETGKQPLSVSSNFIGLTTRSWTDVVANAGVSNRIDTGQGSPSERPIIEVYPGASLKVFAKSSPPNSNISTDDFKKKRASRERTLRGLVSMFGVTDPHGLFDRLVGVGEEDSDAADAFIAALTGLAYLGHLQGWSVRGPSTSNEQSLASTEGWIFFPTK